MKLIDLLLQELPKWGGWPEGVIKFSQDHDGVLRTWSPNVEGKWFTVLDIVCSNHRKTGEIEKETNFTSREEYEAALAAQQEKKWDGEGLPPVGVECLVIPHNNLWGFPLCGDYRGKVIAYKGERFWFEVDFYEDVISRTDKVDFKPIRNEAELKRQEIAQEMCNLFGNGIKIDEKHGYGATWLEVYDAIAAGKIPGVKLAD